MKTTITTVLLGGLIALHATAFATKVLAQCAFEQPTKGGVAKTGRYYTSLVQAFVSCDNPGGNADNTTGLGGLLPAYKLPETKNTLAGSPISGWHFSATANKSWGWVRLERKSGTFVNPPGFSDLRIRACLGNIVDGTQTAVNTAFTGTGTLQLVIRSTFDDPTNHDMTAIDFAGTVASINLVRGNGCVDKTLASFMATLPPGQRFPDCTSHEIVSVAVADPNGTIFAVPGVRINP
jgi:hypothetical protein